ncbi:MAG: N-acetylmannosamine-6-phosphate 2-epimerase [Elusimicrobiaceae bacterium]|nr:N-acetylmannosamine-6-phosphate 2-epimerase [Elusimicrobiaceae bacterium]
MEKGLIVSCQALPHEPLHSSFIMGRMALAAQMAGAVGIRANSIADITEIQKNVNLPIIGIIKQDYADRKAYITPTRKELEALLTLNVDVIALDATINADENLLRSLKKEFPHQQFMADISTAQEAIRAAEEFGFDFVGTTLTGYTEHSKHLTNFEVLDAIIRRLQVPIVAEGNFDTPEKARRALEAGAYAVVVGGAITRPQLIAKKFVEEMQKANVK